MNVGDAVIIDSPSKRHAPLKGMKGKILSFYLKGYFPALVKFDGVLESVWCERHEISEVMEATKDAQKT
jgi:hypothetical protein